MTVIFQLQRAMLGYAAGAGLVVLVVAVMVGPFAGAFAFVVGAALAAVCGVFVFLPVILLLIWIGQLRIWWVVLLAPVLLLAGSSILFPPDDLALTLAFLKRDAAGELVPDWKLIAAAGAAAAAGLIGWLVGFGFRTRPAPPEDDRSA